MSKLRIVLIDYGVGNTRSVVNAISQLDYRVSISDKVADIKSADALVLPGVGAFETVMSNLRSRGLQEVLNEEVLVNQKPILGICAGMQMLATSSEENGHHEGLDWIKGRVVKLDLPAQYSVPHVGWNNISVLKKDILFTRLENDSHFYFDHSYHFVPDNPAHIAATCDYGVNVTAAVQDRHIFGVQFHPEKSQVNGLKLFRSIFSGLAQYA
ncbi:imidazole glycerol phosphate synthase subunit HisH [Flaviaesturariibacter flavus]|uniref:Imidazole glycerol phosphate synthase subunit HisH n=1 Tax=Flaviaesturariibacter flavus TaxID=2502780 RepID=A0A4V2NVP0_9BACT|nr:imidazole glycerol phosphate synthase subunit HisH [Flaviaesturariibacter flavus]TCJ14182.1 imidazole glycerol phosphate synthase subunit HisH [Flaviaesturariibacter flavus]